MPFWQYQRDARQLDRNYSIVRSDGQTVKLRLDFPGEGLADLPELMLSITSVPLARRVSAAILELTATRASAALSQEGLFVRGLNATVLGIIGLIALALFYDFGTLSPCGILRETVRKRDGLAAILPDSIVDLGLAAQYGELSPSRCVAILMNDLKSVTTAQATLPPPSPAPRSPAPQAKVTAQDPVQWAMQVTVQTEKECRAKRIRGELASLRGFCRMF